MLYYRIAATIEVKSPPVGMTNRHFPPLRDAHTAPIISAQSTCTNTTFTYRWRCSPTSPNISGWNTPTLYIPANTFGEGNVTIWLDVTDSLGATRTFTRVLPYFPPGTTPPDA